MGFWKKVAKTAINTTMLPVDIVRDTATLGGVLSNRDESYTGERLGKTKEAVEEASEKLEDWIDDL